MDDRLETHFKSLFKLETNGSPKRRIVQALNNPIYFFNKHINYFLLFFHQIFMNIQNIINNNSIIIVFISESFDLNLYILTLLTNK